MPDCLARLTDRLRGIHPRHDPRPGEFTDEHVHNDERVHNAERAHNDEGMTTAEYAIGTLAAVAFAGALLKVLNSDAVRNALAGIVQRALQ